jgi:hypothetical protein
MNELGCVVCYETITPITKAVIKGCSHEFCLSCIKSWTQTSLNCPLCKQPFSVLQHSFNADGTSTEEVLVTPAITDVAVEEQPNCLDHSFFLAEVSRLLQAAEHAHKQLWLDGRVGRGVSIVEKQQLQVVESVCVELRNHKRRLQSLLQFDPHTVLQDLYRLQGMLESTWGGAYAPSAASQVASPVRYSADDAWEGNISDDDDELAEEMMYLAISRSKQTPKGVKFAPQKLLTQPNTQTNTPTKKKKSKRGKQSNATRNVSVV